MSRFVYIAKVNKSSYKYLHNYLSSNHLPSKHLPIYQSGKVQEQEHLALPKDTFLSKIIAFQMTFTFHYNVPHKVKHNNSLNTDKALCLGIIQ